MTHLADVARRTWRFAILAVFATLALAAPPARAALVSNSVTGVADLFTGDPLGGFGGGGPPVSSIPVTFGYSFDTSGVSLTENDASAIVYSGTAIPVADFSVSVTVNGDTVTMSGGNSSIAFVKAGNAVELQIQGSNMTSSLGFTDGYFDLGTYYYLGYNEPLSLSDFSNSLYGATVTGTHIRIGSARGTGDEFCCFAPDALAPTPVPEPASLVLLSVGMIFVGALHRKHGAA